MMVATRNRWTGLLLLQAVALSVWICWLAVSTHAQDAGESLLEITPDAAPARKAEVIAAGKTPWVGVAGCAAAACHGGPIDQSRGEYTTWITRDPHSRAYSTLFSERSLEMVRLLAGGDAAKATPAHENQRCLACHAPTGPVGEHAARLASDGVGCEACHGAADAWATQHATVRWSELTPEQRSAKRRELGMTDMHDPLVRVQQCTACHIGSAAADVDHDLIAAGHPRMAFEMGAFHAELPKHWLDQEERRRDPTFEAKLWAVGYATSAAAYYELVLGDSVPAFVDFSDYDCFACHHELRAPSWRQEAALPSGSVHYRPGRMQALRWYYPPVIPRMGFDALGWSWINDQDPPQWGAMTEPLLRMLRNSGNQEYAKNLRVLAERMNDPTTWNEDTVKSLTFVIANELPPDLNWDIATQWYLALVALERSRLDFQGSAPPTTQDKQVQAELLALKQMLNFPSPTNGVQLNSPRDFDPAAFRVAAGRLQALIAARPGAKEENGTPTNLSPPLQGGGRGRVESAQ